MLRIAKYVADRQICCRSPNMLRIAKFGGWLNTVMIRDGPVHLVGGGGGIGRMTSEQFFFAAIIGLQLFFLGICRAIFFL